MSNEVGITVIVPVYNVQEYIVECIDSLKRQTFRNFEVIFIDDCSTDRSMDLVKENITEFKRYLMIQNEKNIGVAKSRNKALKRANGKYVFFLDSDDILTENALENLFTCAGRDSGDLVIGKMLIYDQSQQKKYQEEYSMYIGPIYKMFKKYDNIKNIPHALLLFPTLCSKLYKTEIIKKNGLEFADLLHEDDLFSLEMFYYSERIVFTDNYVYMRRFRKEENSITQHYTFKKFHDKMEISCKVFKKCIQFKDMNNLKYALDSLQRTINMNYALMTAKDKVQAKEYLEEKIRYLQINQEYEKLQNIHIFKGLGIKTRKQMRKYNLSLFIKSNFLFRIRLKMFFNKLLFKFQLNKNLNQLSYEDENSK
ncbi:TPA: glycosyltransferase family 2 protein [Bacillus cereus]|nr:glycosyltransferase family 2 protein [Bacillus cereus]